MRNLVKQVNALLLHFPGIVNIPVNGSLYIRMAEAFLYVLDRRSGFNQHGSMGVPQGMVIERQMQLTMDHTADKLERIGCQQGSVRTYADHVCSWKADRDAALHRDDLIDALALFILFRFQVILGKTVTVLKTVFLLRRVCSHKDPLQLVTIQNLPDGCHSCILHCLTAGFAEQIGRVAPAVGRDAEHSGRLGFLPAEAGFHL